MKKLFKLICCVMAMCILLGAFSVSAIDGGEVVLGKTTEFSVSPDDYTTVWFTAPENGFYKFSSISSDGECDVMGYIYDADGNQLAYGDDSADDLNFNIYCYMQAGCTYYIQIGSYNDNMIWAGLKIDKSNIKSVKINNTIVYEGLDTVTSIAYDPESEGFYKEYTYYNYKPSFTVTLNNGTVLQSDESGSIEYEGQSYQCNCFDDQSESNTWGLGVHSATAEVFGYFQSITVTVESNPVESVEINDVTLYDDWDCITITEEWEEILGIEITEPIKIYYYLPRYTVNFKDGTKLVSDNNGMIVYKGRIHIVEIDGDTQDINNLWQVGNTYESSGTVFGCSDTFMVEIKANPMQSVKFDDVTLLKDWDCYYDYEYNENTEEYDLRWKRYTYMPTYTITLNDGTTIKSDENGTLEYDGKTYMLLNLNDGQSYDTPWLEGRYTVPVKIFGAETSFDVVLEEMVSSVGDTNRDGKINNRDYAGLIQYLNDWDVIIDVGAGDVDASNTINNRDCALLMQYLNGWDVELK